MNLFRIYADGDGETHLESIDLSCFPRPEDGTPKRVGIKEIPTTGLTITELKERKPDQGWHPAPRRQLVVVLQGALEVTTTDGTTRRIESGAALLTDDLRGKGHLTREVGEEALGSLIIGIDPAWELPSS